MKQNTFYGKSIDELTPQELQLLSIDIQMMAIIKWKAGDDIMKLAMADEMRTKTVNECMKAKLTGNYSRADFLSENGFFEDPSLKPEIKETQKAMKEFKNNIHSFLSNLMDGIGKKVKDEPNNGKMDKGFQMN